MSIVNKSPRRVFRNMTHSLHWRLIWVFLLFGAASVFVYNQSANSLVHQVWRQAARPLVADYIDRIVADLSTPLDLEKAKQLSRRLPITLEISGPVVNWRSHPRSGQKFGPRYDEDFNHSDDMPPKTRDHRRAGPRFLMRRTADGHRIVFGVNMRGFDGPGGIVGVSLFALLGIAGLAYFCVWLLLRPLKVIGQGVNRFADGDFSQRISVKHKYRDDELTDLADSVNHMADSIEGMLDAKRGLLLAISHELRSPLTRARLNTELIDETTDTQPHRDALLRDLGLMSTMISDLLEGERLADNHRPLQLKLTNLSRVVQNMHEEFPAVVVELGDSPVMAMIDANRISLLMRNLLNNAQHYGVQAEKAPVLSLRAYGDSVIISVRDYGAGVAVEHLDMLSTAFYRPDTARTREHGGVGLGLYLCNMVAKAHGGELRLENARPGLRASCVLPVNS